MCPSAAASRSTRARCARGRRPRRGRGGAVLGAERPAGDGAGLRRGGAAGGRAFINTTSDAVARDPRLLDRYAAAGLPLIGDDLASQFGTSVLHHALLRLLEERGLTLTSSYQVNLGGTEDFRNLVENPNTKHQSKLNALGGVPPGAGGPAGLPAAPEITEGGAHQH